MVDLPCLTQPPTWRQGVGVTSLPSNASLRGGLGRGLLGAVMTNYKTQKAASPLACHAVVSTHNWVPHYVVFFVTNFRFSSPALSILNRCRAIITNFHGFFYPGVGHPR